MFGLKVIAVWLWLWVAFLIGAEWARTDCQTLPPVPALFTPSESPTIVAGCDTPSFFPVRGACDGTDFLAPGTDWMTNLRLASHWTVDDAVIDTGSPAMGVDTDGDWAVLWTGLDGRLMAKCLTDEEIADLPPLDIPTGTMGVPFNPIHVDKHTGVALVKCVEED